MTQIDFYTHVESRLQTACQLCAKAVAQGALLVLYTADAERLREIDRLLWTTPSTGFVPHCRPADRLAHVTPVILAEGADGLPHDEILLNLDDALPEFFARFERLIEIVSTDDQDRERARGRFRYYRDRGYEIRTHDLGKSARV